MKKTIRPPIAPCLECGRGYDVRELGQLKQLEPVHEEINRYRCADCGTPVAVAADVERDAAHWTIDAEDYAEKFPNHPPRPVLWETDAGNRVPAWLAWLATTTDRRVFVVALVLLALAFLPDLRADIVAWLEANW